MKVDKTDKQILAILQKDGRVSASNIATELDISIPTVTDRIKKLQDSGIIKGIHAVLDPKPLGLDVAAIITLISESSFHYKEVTEAAEKMPEVLQCLTTTGKGSHCYSLSLVILHLLKIYLGQFKVGQVFKEQKHSLFYLTIK